MFERVEAIAGNELQDPSWKGSLCTKKEQATQAVQLCNKQAHRVGRSYLQSSTTSFCAVTRGNQVW